MGRLPCLILAGMIARVLMTEAVELESEERCAEEAEDRGERIYSAGSENRKTGHRPRSIGGLEKLRR